MEKLTFFQKVLTITACFLLLIILISTCIVLFSRSNINQKNNPSPSQIELQNNYNVFNRLGKIRTVTADSIPILIVPYFPYPKEDIEFYEELVLKTRKIKLIISDSFSTYTKDQLLTLGEQSIKQTILKKINENLVLGSIPALYFSEYMFFE